jgi:hypothetical protein
MLSRREVLTRQLKSLNGKVARLSEELERIDTVGFRAICYGDMYDYGGYANYLFSEYGRREAKERAEDCVKRSEHGGHVEPVLRGREKLEWQVH